MDYQKVAVRLQQNFANTTAQMISQYEGQIAVMQEQYEQKIAELEAKIESADVGQKQEG